MRMLRNPFRIRAAEHAVTDDTFVKLFAPGILEVLHDQEGLWDRPAIFRSAPGGGKTSLFRLFTPGSLLSIYNSRNQDYCKDTWIHLQKLGAIDESGSKLLSVVLPNGGTYSVLSDLSSTGAKRIFFSLLNAHIVLGTLRSICSLHKLTYPKDVDLISVLIKENSVDTDPIPPVTNGADLYEWASEMESGIYDMVDSLALTSETTVKGSDGLSALRWLDSSQFKIKEQLLTLRPLVLLDDLQKLAIQQRDILLKEVTDARTGVAVWLAERLEALRQDELISGGALPGRDFACVIELEDFWRDKPVAFKKFLANIANKRAEAAQGTEITSFDNCFQGSLDAIEWKDRLKEIVKDVEGRVKENYQSNPRYTNWITDCEEFSGSPRENVIKWRTLEIAIAREERKRQGEFDFGPLNKAELQSKASSLENAAELFVTHEFGIPYYFSMDSLAKIASANVEQFLSFGGDLFEEVLSSALLKMDKTLPIERQEKILQTAASRRWDELPQHIPNGRAVRRLLDAIGKFASDGTYQDNAPYSPGVTGIGIPMTEVDRLRDPEVLAQQPDLKYLTELFNTCLAHNLLHAREDVKQSNNYWMVLYLNRMLCVKFKLPLAYGGWNKVPIKDLARWAVEGRKAVGIRKSKKRPSLPGMETE